MCTNFYSSLNINSYVKKFSPKIPQIDMTGMTVSAPQTGQVLSARGP